MFFVLAVLQIGDGDRDASFDREVGRADQFLTSIDADMVSVILPLKSHVSIFRGKRDGLCVYIHRSPHEAHE